MTVANILLLGPYFATFLMVYFKNTGDSIFYARYLNLAKGLDGKGCIGLAIQSIYVEALSQCEWSAEYVLYESPPGPGGYNYAGTVHPEYFNRDYYKGTNRTESNPWYGQGVVAAPTGWWWEDGKHLMLSWTSQLHGGANTGVYQIMMAAVEFDTLTDRAAFWGGSSQALPPSRLPGSTHMPKPTTSLLPVSESESEARCLRDSLSLLTLLCKLVIVAAVTIFAKLA